MDKKERLDLIDKAIADLESLYREIDSEKSSEYDVFASAVGVKASINRLADNTSIRRGVYSR